MFQLFPHPNSRQENGFRIDDRRVARWTHTVKISGTESPQGLMLSLGAQFTW